MPMNCPTCGRWPRESRVGADFQHSLPPQLQLRNAPLVLVARHLILEALSEKPDYSNVVREAGRALAELEKAPPAHDVLTGGASLRDYFAAQALRSHYIIDRIPPGVTDPRTYLAELCYEIADEFMACSIRPPAPSPGTPPATPASPPNPSIHQREVPR